MKYDKHVEWLRNEVAKAGMTREQIANILEADYSTVVRWLNGRMKLDKMNFLAVCYAIGIKGKVIQLYESLA